MQKIISTVTAAGGMIGTYLYGGWSDALIALLTLIAIDYATGVISAGVTGQLQSNEGYKGIARKVGILLLVALGHYLDVLLGSNMLQAAIIYFYLANEALSIIENVGQMGVPIPSILKKAVAVLQEKGDEKQ